MTGDGKPSASLAERLRAVHEKQKREEAAPGEPQKDKGGRRPGSKVVIGPDGKKRVVAAEKIAEAVSAINDPSGDVMSGKNFKHLLSPICATIEQTTGVKISDEDRTAGAELHAACMRNHAPAWMKDYADLAMCLGWWAGIGMQIAVKLQQKTPQGVVQNAEAPSQEAPKGPDTGSGKAPIGQPGGFLSKVS